MEHLLYECLNYSSLVWEQYEQVLTRAISVHSGELVPPIQFTYLEIIYNKPPPCLLEIYPQPINP